MSESSTREGRYGEIAKRYGSREKPPLPLPRYLVRVSTEAASDLGDEFEFHDAFGAAEQAGDAYAIWDLDTGQRFALKRLQQAIAVPEMVCWHLGATVYPDGTVERWERAEVVTAHVALDDHLNRMEVPWDGHTQGHCGFHISIRGSSKRDALQARREVIRRYRALCDGTCSCGRSENYIRHFGDSEEVTVTLVGGPNDGDVRVEAISKALRDNPRSRGVGSGVLCCFSASFKDGDWAATTHWTYGFIEKEGGRFVRRYVDKGEPAERGSMDR